MAKTRRARPQSQVEQAAMEQLAPRADGAGYAIQVNGVSKSFGAHPAVRDLSFDVSKGEVVGFLGPNGSGKTTTMRLITSYYTPDSGNILIDGMDTQEQDIATRDRIGYLPESNPLYSDLLVKEYLSFVADIRKMPKEQKKGNIEQAVEEAGLEEVYYRPISQLSKGYRQRVGLAQAILHRPSVLILDEPTEGLDPNQRFTIRELIRQLGRERTVLLSTHVMQEVEVTCSRALIIRRGQLVADSPVKEMLQGIGQMTGVMVEVEGNEVESGLRELPGVSAVERMEPIAGRKRYVVAVDGEHDPRPDIFALAKRRNWVLWELHEQRARLEDIFHGLTTEQEGEGE